MEQTTPATLPALRERAAMQNTQIGFSDAAGFDLAQRIAKAFSMSSMVPAQYQNNIPNCLIAIDMASRMGASPLLVSQNLYIVQGRPTWSAKFLIATMNQCGRYSSIRYEWQSEQGKPDWGCRAYAFEKTTGERVQSSWITWKLVEAEGWNKKSGSKWLTMPEQMFMYRAAAWLVNTHAPEISMGLNTAEELNDTFDADADDSGTYTVITETVKDRIAGMLEDVKEDVVVEEVPAAPAKTDEPDPHADWKASIDEIADMEGFIAALNKMPVKVKKELHAYLEAKQASIRAKTAAPAQSTSSID
jgi:hypothetical protein